MVSPFQKGFGNNLMTAAAFAFPGLSWGTRAFQHAEMAASVQVLVVGQTLLMPQGEQS
jgi:hypothetical protein